MRRDPSQDGAQGALRRAIERASGNVPEVPAKVRFEMRRKVLHVLTAIVAVPILIFLPFLLAVGLATAGILVITLTWAIERRRLPRDFAGPLHDELAHVLNTTRREGEDFPWSPVLYTLSLILIGLAHEFLGMSWSIAFAAYAILGIGDAASALVGVAYGRHKLPWNPKKSVEGTLAGLVAGGMAGAVMASIPFAFAAASVPPLFFLVVLAGATAGALSETVPRVEDNFIVPISSAAVMFALTTAFGLSPP